jgi:hypothetical protein
MVAGGAKHGGCSLSDLSSIEVFNPPYMFYARPRIDAAPAEGAYGETIAIDTPNAASIESVVLVKPMAVTHQTDTEQRLVSLEFTRNGGGLTAALPENRNVAPRGYYMLFIVGPGGLPSVARFIRLN